MMAEKKVGWGKIEIEKWSCHTWFRSSEEELKQIKKQRECEEKEYRQREDLVLGVNHA